MEAKAMSTEGTETTAISSGSVAVQEPTDIPKDRLEGLKQNWRSDIVCGFILFLIALPLSLGIAMASGVPPMAGLISAIVGGIVVSQISGSFVTINGPAAGLIVVILGAIDGLGGGTQGYHAALAASAVSGLILFVLGLCRAGELGDFFPSTVVHGMLAAIGIIIMSKQLPFVLGVAPPSKEPLQLIAAIPTMLMHMNPHIATIGFVSFALLIVYNLIKNQAIKRIPAPIIVVATAIVLGQILGLEHQHAYLFGGQTFNIDPKKVLVVLPQNLADGITHPDFSQIASTAFWMAVLSITLVQGIETLLSCAAVDKLDRFKRHANLSKDMAAVGLGSTISAMFGGLPMIAEIVRSSANIANGARTRWSNFFHGSFILIFLLIAASLIDKIPLAALAALLVMTGYRLASPKVFAEMHKIGWDQTVVFVATIVTILATDLLIGVGVGILVKLALHVLKGAPVMTLFRADTRVQQRGDTYDVKVKGAAIFANYLSLKGHLSKIPDGKQVLLDLSELRLVDHSVMEHLHHLRENYLKAGGRFEVVGLDALTPTSSHLLSSRRLKFTR